MVEETPTEVFEKPVRRGKKTPPQKSAVVIGLARTKPLPAPAEIQQPLHKPELIAMAETEQK